MLTANWGRASRGVIPEGLTIIDLGISTRAMNCIANHYCDETGVFVDYEVPVSWLIRKAPHECLRWPYFGRKSLREVEAALALHGLKLGTV